VREFSRREAPVERTQNGARACGRDGELQILQAVLREDCNAVTRLKALGEQRLCRAVGARFERRVRQSASPIVQRHSVGSTQRRRGDQLADVGEAGDSSGRAHSDPALLGHNSVLLAACPNEFE
jgi:hypothetical protein